MKWRGKGGQWVSVAVMTQIRTPCTIIWAHTLRIDFRFCKKTNQKNGLLWHSKSIPDSVLVKQSAVKTHMMIHSEYDYSLGLI